MYIGAGTGLMEKGEAYVRKFKVNKKGRFFEIALKFKRIYKFF